MGKCSIALHEPITGGSVELTSRSENHCMTEKSVKIQKGNSFFTLPKKTGRGRIEYIEGDEDQAVGSASRNHHRFD